MSFVMAAGAAVAVVGGVMKASAASKAQAAAQMQTWKIKWKILPLTKKVWNFNLKNQPRVEPT